MTYKFLVSMSSCLGWLKSFLATTTPSSSTVSCSFSVDSHNSNSSILLTLEQVGVDLLSVFLRNQHFEIISMFYCMKREEGVKTQT